MSSFPVQPSLSYYLARFTSEYQNATNLKAFASLLMQPFLDVTACADTLDAAFNINTAVGIQLDKIGTLLGVSRTLPFTPVGVNATTTSAVSSTGSQTVTVNNTTYMTIGGTLAIGGASPENVVVTAIVQGVSFTAVFSFTHLSGVSVTSTPPSGVLGDSDYRVLLKARVIFNQFNGFYMGSKSILWLAWQLIFPGGTIYILDNQNMTATITLAGVFSVIQQQMITNGLIVPRCQGVQFTYVFALLPLFGFDGANPTLVAGFDVGHFA
jgi:hypothetical protein